MPRPLRYLSLLISAVIALAGLQALALSGTARPTRRRLLDRHRPPPRR